MKKVFDFLHNARIIITAFVSAQVFMISTALPDAVPIYVWLPMMIVSGLIAASIIIINSRG